MKTSPAFQFYVKDWLTDMRVRLLEPDERSYYIDALCHQWLEGGIPSDMAQLSKLLGSGMAKLDKVVAFFVAHPTDLTRLVNARMEIERTKLEEFKEERSVSGRKGAAKRWKKTNKTRRYVDNGSASGSAINQPLANDMANDGSSVPRLQTADCRLQTADSSIAPKRARTVRDDLFDALLAVDKIPPDGVGDRGSEFGKLVSTLLNTDPSATPEKIRRYAANYPTHYDAALTAHAIVRWWHKCKEPGNNGKLVRIDPTEQITGERVRGKIVVIPGEQ